MEPKGIEMGLVVFLVLMLWNGAAAQSGCTRALMGLSPCLNYVTGNSSTPSSSCCSQLSNVVQSQPQCLCSLLNGGGSSYGISVNQTLALALPGVCKVQTPPISRCNAASEPTATAASEPTAAAASEPSASAATPESAPVGSPSPAESPSDFSDETPEIPTEPSESSNPSTEPSESSNPSAGAGSKTVPSNNGASSDGSTIKSPLQVAVFLLFIVSCASTATIF
ncbi:hypothetical protein Vadar_016777 [Vaccinium darrowii]|uniref:Uncharacterized protein n=1 Tax=Vaccinium darrowii TaxID=229202 RepID=A0ACB7ZCQ7_9ERIC|nr:hypothetical protein Vadar_016777 [Vaccinium darrowii]